MMEYRMEYRYPDDPIRLPPSSAMFANIDKDGSWRAGPKRNGWRRLAYKENGIWTLHAKRDTSPEAKRPLSADLVKRLAAFPIPDGTALDLEWMGTRDVAYTGGQPQWLEAIDIHYWNYQWQGDLAFDERMKSLADLIALCAAADGSNIKTLVLVPTWKDDIYKQFCRLAMEWKTSSEALAKGTVLQTEGAISEGVVLKKGTGKLRGDRTHTVDNPFWAKVKYREG